MGGMLAILLPTLACGFAGVAVMAVVFIYRMRSLAASAGPLSKHAEL